MFVRSDDQYRMVRDLFSTGWSDYEIARRTGVPRSTVQKWRHSERKRWAPRDWSDWRPPDGPIYCYLLVSTWAMATSHIGMTGLAHFVSIWTTTTRSSSRRRLERSSSRW